MFRDFAAILKDMTSSSVHTPTAIGNEAGKGKYRPFKAIIAEVKTDDGVAKRHLQPNGDTGTAKSPFPYDPNALGSLRPDQVPRFFGVLTDSDKLPRKEVKLGDLTAMQDRVDPKKVEAIRDNGTQGKLAVVVQHNGKQFIADGHHRLAADWLDGKDTVLVRHKDLEPIDHALKGAPRLNVRVAKIDDALGVVLGWAIVCKVNGEDYYDLNIDHSGPHAGESVPEHVPEPVMAKSALQFVDSGAIGNEMHEGPDVGSYPFVFPMSSDAFKALFGTTDTPPKTGLLVGYRPPADVLAKFKSREYTGFSIEGRRISFEEHPQ
jgi:hypothetical protein